MVGSYHIPVGGSILTLKFRQCFSLSGVVSNKISTLTGIFDNKCQSARGCPAVSSWNNINLWVCLFFTLKFSECFALSGGWSLIKFQR